MVPRGGIENSCPMLSVPSCQPWTVQSSKKLPKNKEAKSETDALLLGLFMEGNDRIFRSGIFFR